MWSRQRSTMARGKIGKQGRWGQRKLAAVGAAAAVSLTMAACGSDDGGASADDSGWKGDVRVVVPTPAGGGFGLVAQRIQPHFAEALGVNVDMSFNDAGGQEAAVATYVANTRDACGVIIVLCWTRM